MRGRAIIGALATLLPVATPAQNPVVEDALRAAIAPCWNPAPIGADVPVRVTLGFALTPEGRVDGDVRLLSSDGPDSFTFPAFQTARRAVLRCQGQGFDLPPDRHADWRDVVISFYAGVDADTGPQAGPDG